MHADIVDGIARSGVMPDRSTHTLDRLLHPVIAPNRVGEGTAWLSENTNRIGGKL
jgi:hypothetical protein